jgi:hypothetical protein
LLINFNYNARSLTKYTNPAERILCNFSGSGTDALEGFLLGRRVVTVDLNPRAIAVTQDKLTFALPPELRKYLLPSLRPTCLVADSKDLTDTELFGENSFAHVLSHLPYFKAIFYSDLEDDLSRAHSLNHFVEGVNKVAAHTWRMLMPGRRCTIGIGDNREAKFYLPISFFTVREYMREGLILEDLVRALPDFMQA